MERETDRVRGCRLSGRVFGIIGIMTMVGGVGGSKTGIFQPFLCLVFLRGTVVSPGGANWEIIW